MERADLWKRSALPLTDRLAMIGGENKIIHVLAGFAAGRRLPCGLLVGHKSAPFLNR